MKSHKNSERAKIEKLAKALSVEPEDIFIDDCQSHYGLSVFGCGRAEYAFGTEQEVDEACQNYIRDSIWSFKPEFILEACSLPFGLKKAIEIFQKEECENANEPLFELVEKNCGLIQFSAKAISADGRGHFLGSYDGKENEIVGADLFFYRI
jgi:hypothetical protein